VRRAAGANLSRPTGAFGLRPPGLLSLLRKGNSFFSLTPKKNQPAMTMLPVAPLVPTNDSINGQMTISSALQVLCIRLHRDQRARLVHQKACFGQLRSGFD